MQLLMKKGGGDWRREFLKKVVGGCSFLVDGMKSRWKSYYRSSNTRCGAVADDLMGTMMHE